MSSHRPSLTRQAFRSSARTDHHIARRQNERFPKLPKRCCPWREFPKPRQQTHPAWAQPAAFTFGNAAPSYNMLRNFGSIPEDFSIQQNFNLLERHVLQFRTGLLGRITCTDPPSSIQMALKWTF